MYTLLIYLHTHDYLLYYNNICVSQILKNIPNFENLAKELSTKHKVKTLSAILCIYTSSV